jgi:stage III sporulation protein AB
MSKERSRSKEGSPDEERQAGAVIMLKLFGAALILLAGTLFGWYQALQLSRRPTHIAELIRGLQRLETEIVYGFTPLSEALRSIGERSPGPVGAVFAQAGKELSEPAGRSARDIWQHVITQQWRNTSMKPSEREIVSQLGATLGLTDRDDQVKHLRLAILQLQGENETAREEQAKYERMWKSLGVLLGALIVIIMY